GGTGPRPLPPRGFGLLPPPIRPRPSPRPTLRPRDRGRGLRGRGSASPGYAAHGSRPVQCGSAPAERHVAPAPSLQSPNRRATIGDAGLPLVLRREGGCGSGRRRRPRAPALRRGPGASDRRASGGTRPRRVSALVAPAGAGTVKTLADWVASAWCFGQPARATHSVFEWVLVGIAACTV